MTTAGRVILLNGTSSSGKSTLVKALQARLEGPWLGVGIDTVVFALPGAYLNQPLWGEVFRYVPAEPGSSAPYRMETGELGVRLIHGLHGMVAALVDEGHDVIVDHVLVEADWLPDLGERLGDAELTVVGVRCPLEVVTERERARKDRTVGQAAALYDVIHRGAYDVEVDTSVLSPDEAADVIAAVVEGSR